MKMFPLEKTGVLRLVRSLALLVFVLGGESTQTAEVLAGEPLSVVDPRLWEELEGRASVPVMVRLRHDSGPPVPGLLRAGPSGSGAVGGYRSRIRRLQEDFESAMEPYRARGYRRHGLQPLVRLDADAETVARLAQLPMVERIREERVFRPSLSVSVPQIGVDGAWGFGYTGAGQVVVVMDTGVQTDHEFLAGKVPRLDADDPGSLAEACFSVARDPRSDADPDNDDLAILTSYC